MSGHSKWATIKHKKGAADAKRGQMFTKLIKEITIAARIGGGDPEGNPRLRTAILKARGANMPKDNITNAIKKGTGELEGVSYEELSYEARLGEAAFLIEVLTDNRNRAAADVRNILSRAGAELAKAGSVSRLLTRKGVITIDSEKFPFDKVEEIAIENNAEDVAEDDGVIEITTASEDFEAVAKALEEAEIETTSAEISMLPEAPVTLSISDTGKVLRLIEKLEDNDDVQNVYSNIEVPEDYTEE